MEKLRLMHPDKIIIDNDHLVVLDGINMNGTPLNQEDCFLVISISKKTQRLITKEYFTDIIIDNVFYDK